MPHRAAPVRRPAGPTLLLLACILPALAAPACTPEPPTPPPATSGFGAGAALHSPADAPLPGLVEDLGRFAGLDNEARGDTLLAIFRERGFEPAIHAFPNPQVEREPRPEGRNLVVEVGAGAREILVGAHYDAAPLPGGRYTGGAVDNGAGAVILTRVAETLRGHDLAHRVRVALFDLEEWGLLGSAAFARELDPGAVAAMVNVDIAAYGTTIGYGPASHEGNEAVYQALATVCVVQAIPCLEFPAYPVSDDRTFQNAGIPNVSMAILERAEAHQLWLLLNGGPEPGIAEGFVPRVGRVIHTEEDRLEHAEAGAMTRMHDAVVALVLELDRVMRDG
jgi:hypothetical protein